MTSLDTSKLCIVHKDNSGEFLFTREVDFAMFPNTEGQEDVIEMIEMNGGSVRVYDKENLTEYTIVLINLLPILEAEEKGTGKWMDEYFPGDGFNVDFIEDYLANSNVNLVDYRVSETEYQEHDPIDVLLQRKSWQKLKKLKEVHFLYSIGEFLKVANQKEDDEDVSLPNADDCQNEIEASRVVDQEAMRETSFLKAADNSKNTNRKRSTRKQSQTSSSESSPSPPKVLRLDESGPDSSGSISLSVRSKLNTSIDQIPGTESSESETGLDTSKQSRLKDKVEFESPRAYQVPVDARGRIKRSVRPKGKINTKKQPGEWINATAEPISSSVLDSNIELSEGEDEDHLEETSRQSKAKPIKGWSPYPLRESQKILDFIVANDWGEYVNGNKLWKFLEKEKILENCVGVRPWKGLRGHFVKIIIPKLSTGRYTIAPDKRRRLEKPMNKFAVFPDQYSLNRIKGLEKVGFVKKN